MLIKEETFTEVAYLNGNKGIHVSNGIYKVEAPFRIHTSTWTKDNANTDYAIIGTNYTLDYQYCDVVYFTNHDYGKLMAMVRELNKSKPDEFGYIQSFCNTNLEILGGYRVV